MRLRCFAWLVASALVSCVDSSGTGPAPNPVDDAAVAEDAADGGPVDDSAGDVSDASSAADVSSVDGLFTDVAREAAADGTAADRAAADGTPADGIAADSTTADGPIADSTTADSSADATAVDGGDAAPDPFGCLGQPLPTTAPATVTVSGIVVAPDQTPVDAVALDAFVGASATPAATTTSNATGAFTFDLSTGGTPVDGFIQGSKAGFIDTFYYAPVPLAASTTRATILISTPSTFSTIAALAQVVPDPTMGTVVIGVVNCQAAPVEGATVTVQPAGTTRYLRNNVPNVLATATDATGLALVFNVPAGAATVGASFGGLTLRSHPLTVRANVITVTVVAP